MTLREVRNLVQRKDRTSTEGAEGTSPNLRLIFTEKGYEIKNPLGGP